MPSTSTPTDNGITLDQFNDQLRQTPGWAAFMQRAGFRLDGSPIRLSDSQRRALRSELERNGMRFERGMEIDQAGNVNQDQRILSGRNILIAAGIAGAALTGFGAAGIGPLAGMMGGGAAAAGGGGAAAAAGGGAAAAGGASTAATMAGAASAGGGFWGTANRILSNPAVTRGIDAAGGYLSNRAQANASREGTEAQLQATREAIAWEREQYENDQRFFAPYAAQSQAGWARMSDLAGQRRDPVSADSIFASGRAGGTPPPTTPPTTDRVDRLRENLNGNTGVAGPMGPPRLSDMVGGTPAPSQMTPDGPRMADMVGGERAPSQIQRGGQTADELVTVESPDGEQQQMPQHLAERFVQRGARIVRAA